MLSLTFILYLSIMLSTTILASASQKKRHDGTVVFRKKLFWMAFLVHWIFIAFTNIGTDHDSYVAILEYDAFRRIAMGSEVGFNGLCLLLYQFTHNAEIGIFIIKTLTLGFAYLSFYLLRERASMGWVVGAYNAWQYLFSFCILAHSLSISLVILAATLAISGKKWYGPVALTALASTIHASALVMLLVMIGLYALNIVKTKLSFSLVVILLIAAMITLNNISTVFNYFVTDVSGFEQYENNDMSGNVGSGLFNYVLFAYLFVIIIIPVLQSKMEYNYRNAIILFYMFSLISALMGYYLGTARLNQYSIVFYGVAIPWFFYQQEHKLIQTKPFLTLDMQRIAWMVYVLFVAYSSLRMSANPAGTRDMANYVFFNPFS